MAIITVIIASLTFAQSSFKKNDIYVEAGGNGLFGAAKLRKTINQRTYIWSESWYWFLHRKRFLFNHSSWYQLFVQTKK